jgi:hypothetical protein
MRQPERASWVFASRLLIYAGATTRLPAFRLLHLVGNLGLGWLDVAGDIANVEEKPRHAVHRSGGRRLPSSAARSLPPCRTPAGRICSRDCDLRHFIQTKCSVR